MTKLYAYCNRSSDGLNNLINGLRESGIDIKRIKTRNSRYRAQPDHLILNWGCSNIPDFSPAIIINIPQAISIASNKLSAIRNFVVNNIPTVQFTTDRSEAETWCDEERKVFARTTLTGHSGAGIVVCTNTSDLPDAPLYTLNIGRRTEYRVHVFDNEVIDIQQKKRVNSEEEPNFTVRNHQNGWVYCREDVSLHERYQQIAKDAVKVLGLVFGAVDLCITPRGKAVVLEVNTAPGLEGTTVQKYVEAIKSNLEE